MEDDAGDEGDVVGEYGRGWIEMDRLDRLDKLDKLDKLDRFERFNEFGRFKRLLLNQQFRIELIEPLEHFEQ